MFKSPKILFFIESANPTVRDYQDAEKCGSNVAFRNASAVPKECNPEKCDGVAGAIPPAYSKIQSAGKAIATFEKEKKKKLAEETKVRKEADKATKEKTKAVKTAKEETNAAVLNKKEADKKVSEAKRKQNALAASNWKPNA